MDSFAKYFTGEPWLIAPERFKALLITIRNFFGDHDMKLNLVNDPDDEKSKEPDGYGYDIIDGIAVINISGVLEKKWSWYMRYFPKEWMSTEIIGKDITRALNDAEVKAILLDIDSPGGQVAGTLELGEIVFNGRKQKKITALANGMMASAAYWIGSAATYVYSTYSSFVGSIGVITVHASWVDFFKDAGVEITVMRAGKYKALGNPYEKLGKEAQETIQGELDYIYGLFINNIAKHRGVPAKQVKNEMADGRLFIGKQALTAGLVDKMVNMNKIVIPI